jgi:hypothetical protein
MHVILTLGLNNVDHFAVILENIDLLNAVQRLESHLFEDTTELGVI